MAAVARAESPHLLVTPEHCVFVKKGREEKRIFAGRLVEDERSVWSASTLSGEAWKGNYGMLE